MPQFGCHIYPRAFVRKPGIMNRMEKAFAGRLELFKKSGEITDYRFEAVTLRLTPKTTYTPDFLVVTDHITLYEVKGFRRDDAMVKLKVAAEMFPFFEFILVTQDRQGWKYTAVKPQ